MVGLVLTNFLFSAPSGITMFHCNEVLGRLTSIFKWHMNLFYIITTAFKLQNIPPTWLFLCTQYNGQSWGWCIISGSLTTWEVLKYFCKQNLGSCLSCYMFLWTSSPTRAKNKRKMAMGIHIKWNVILIIHSKVNILSEIFSHFIEILFRLNSNPQ